MVVDDKKRYRTEVKEWCFRLPNDPEYFEKWRYINTINDYNNLIEEFQRLYEKTPTTNHLMRARILSGMKNQKETSKTQAEYEIFKKYKTRTAISK